MIRICFVHILEMLLLASYSTNANGAEANVIYGCCHRLSFLLQISVRAANVHAHVKMCA